MRRRVNFLIKEVFLTVGEKPSVGQRSMTDCADITEDLASDLKRYSFISKFCQRLRSV